MAKASSRFGKEEENSQTFRCHTHDQTETAAARVMRMVLHACICGAPSPQFVPHASALLLLLLRSARARCLAPIRVRTCGAAWDGDWGFGHSAGGVIHGIDAHATKPANE